MKSVPRAFWHEFRGAFERLPVWLPGTRIQLGDIGLLSPAGWAPVSTLAEQGVSFAVGEPGAPVDVDYHSFGGADVSPHLSVDGGPLLGPVAGVGSSVRYSFSRQGAFVLKATALRARQIVDVDAVAEQAYARYRAGTWQPGWTVVTEVGWSGPAMILVSGRAGAEATVDFDVAVPALSAGIGAGIRVSNEHGLAAAFVSPGPSTVMWGGRYVRDPLLGRTRFDLRGSANTASTVIDEALSFAELTGPEWPSEGMAKTD